MKIKTTDIEYAEYEQFNPIKMTDDEFNMLCENMQKHGITEAVQVYKLKNGTYKLAHGEHRLKACIALGIEELEVDKDVKVLEGLETGDEVKLYQMRMNVIKGKIDPEKFTKLYDELADNYGKEMTKQMMGFSSEADFERVYKAVRSSLSPELQLELDKMKREIKTIDGLSEILNSLFSRYGESLKYNFMTFEYGGRKHTVVIMDRPLKDQVERLKEYCSKLKHDICPYLTDAIRELFKGEGDD